MNDYNKYGTNGNNMWNKTKQKQKQTRKNNNG